MQNKIKAITVCCPLAIVCAFCLAGCVTNDFKVVDALQVEMDRKEARTTIGSYGFEVKEILERPIEGWSKNDDTFTNLPGRAKYVEERSGKIVKVAEYYPVGHGFLGFGQLFVFYDSEEKIVDFYRRQIN